MKISLRKHNFLYSILFLCFLLFSSFSKNEVYEAIKNKNNTKIEALINQIQTSKSDDKNAYFGACLMFQSQFIKDIKIRIEQFKQGKDLLEEAINKNEQMYEYRFLRLIIQENAPAVLKYNKNLEEDALIIKNNFNKLPKSIQKNIKDYAKISKSLNL